MGVKEPGKGAGPGPKLQANSTPGPGQSGPPTSSGKAPGNRVGGGGLGGSVSSWPPRRVRRPEPDPRPAGWSHPLAREAPRLCTRFLPGAGMAATSQAP